jgi:hypothetical protein
MVYLGFFAMYLVLGVLLISGVLIPESYGLVDLPMYQPLNYTDLLILLGLNIPTFIIIILAIKRLKTTSDG